MIVSESSEQPVPLEETTAALRRFVQPVAVVALTRPPSAGARLLPALAAFLGPA